MFFSYDTIDGLLCLAPPVSISILCRSLGNQSVSRHTQSELEGCWPDARIRRAHGSKRIVSFLHNERSSAAAVAGLRCLGSLRGGRASDQETVNGCPVADKAAEAWEIAVIYRKIKNVIFHCTHTTNYLWPTTIVTHTLAKLNLSFSTSRRNFTLFDAFRRANN